MISHRCLKPGRNPLYLPPLVPSRSSSRSPATGLRQSGVRAVYRQKTQAGWRRRNLRHIAARETIDQVRAQGLQLSRQSHGLLDIPAPIHPIGGRNTHEQRCPFWPNTAYGSHDRTQHSNAILKRTAVEIGPTVVERGQKLMNQISMSGVNLDDPKTGFAGPPSRFGESIHDLVNAVAGKGLGQGIVIGERHGARSHHFLATPGAFGNHSISFPGPVRTGLATGVCQIASRQHSLAHE